MSNKNIVAIGGGGFGRSLGDLIIERYGTFHLVVGLAKKVYTIYEELNV